MVLVQDVTYPYTVLMAALMSLKHNCVLKTSLMCYIYFTFPFNINIPKLLIDLSNILPLTQTPVSRSS